MAKDKNKEQQEQNQPGRKGQQGTGPERESDVNRQMRERQGGGETPQKPSKKESGSESGKKEFRGSEQEKETKEFGQAPEKQRSSSIGERDRPGQKNKS